MSLLVLLKDWTTEAIDTSLYKPDLVRKTSSKLDALILIFLGRANSRIRKTCLLILIYSFKIFSAIIGPKESSLLYILLRKQNHIIKDSITALSLNHLDNFALSDSVVGGLKAIDFFDMCCSNYVHFYRYYFGSLAKIFAETADIRSICHLNKYLHVMVLPRLHIQASSVSSVVNSLTSTILIFAFAGATVILTIFNIQGELRGELYHGSR